MFAEAFLAGVWACIGSTFGKLSGSTIAADSYMLWACLLIVMVMANTWGCRYYLRSLDAASNSVTPTIISSASNYVLSGIIGALVFFEGASTLWWLGASLITVGLALVSNPEKKHMS